MQPEVLSLILWTIEAVFAVFACMVLPNAKTSASLVTGACRVALNRAGGKLWWWRVLTGAEVCGDLRSECLEYQAGKIKLGAED